MKILHRLSGLLVACFFSADVLAHDFWIEAAPFYTEPGETVELSLHVGNEYVGDSMPNIASRYQMFSLFDGDNNSPIDGELGRDPAGYFQPGQAGTYLVAYQSVFQNTTIVSDTFEKYLLDEGLNEALQQVLAQSQNRKEKHSERYMRHAKSLIQVGDSFARDSSRLQLGLELELVPQKNPYQLKAGDALDLRLYYRGKPASNLQVVAFSQASPESMQVQRSGNNGLVTVSLDRPGPWLVKAVHIRKLENDSQEWESHWASLTFSVR